ncbi:hypothetical protein BDV96DRAFT_601381 [Lophiotrema nucula]|uniref:Uncharacterized protein n=1 Tax=Lophiotrema nucula TaxID=690887 RepID=A0A6A5Z431_9PLEO|nr:hypothetical protein BDV96DRAFT_601381 [Lophiotrema nucula]
MAVAYQNHTEREERHHDKDVDRPAYDEWQERLKRARREDSSEERMGDDEKSSPSGDDGTLASRPQYSAAAGPRSPIRNLEDDEDLNPASHQQRGSRAARPTRPQPTRTDLDRDLRRLGQQPSERGGGHIPSSIDARHISSSSSERSTRYTEAEREEARSFGNTGYINEQRMIREEEQRLTGESSMGKDYGTSDTGNNGGSG